MDGRRVSIEHMFDTGKAETKQETFRRLRQELQNQGVGDGPVCQVPEAFAPLFPSTGLQSGQLISVSGPGAWTVGFALAGANVGSQGWAAMVDVGNAGLVAAHELGIPLDRLLVVDSTPMKAWVSVVAALLEVAEVVIVNPRRELKSTWVRRLRTHLQDHQSLVLSLDGGRFWPEKLDASLTVSRQEWHGVGEGFGHLQHRQLEIESTGRRSLSGRRRCVTVQQKDGSFSIVDTPTWGDDKPAHRFQPTYQSEPFVRSRR